MRKYLLFLIVAVLGVIVMFDDYTGFAARSLPSWAGPLQLQGGISDINGNPLSTKTGDFWNVPSGPVRVIPGYFSDVVAFDSNGRVLGSGANDQLKYSLHLGDEWFVESSLDVAVGYYNPSRPEQSRLHKCTSLDVGELVSFAKRKKGVVYKDLVCNFTVTRR
ncbi:hypothetical protein KY309_02945 [Candidatus Woesearchaeota archaeon]|nr:hypothetical protein [Candidatus Woesearchaeota archaeon]MBW3016543.1 hypothetical protein [Candidatus Woesearchaeota archaeon]